MTTTTLATQFPFTLYATTPAGYQFAVASYPTLAMAVAAIGPHRAAHPRDIMAVVDRRGGGDHDDSPCYVIRNAAGQYWGTLSLTREAHWLETPSFAFTYRTAHAAACALLSMEGAATPDGPFHRGYVAPLDLTPYLSGGR